MIQFVTEKSSYSASAGSAIGIQEKSEHFNRPKPIVFELCKKNNGGGGGQIDPSPQQKQG